MRPIDQVETYLKEHPGGHSSHEIMIVTGLNRCRVNRSLNSLSRFDVIERVETRKRLKYGQILILWRYKGEEANVTERAP